ncbi:hypothetical protein V6N13_001138 [Hibiscus sabdariffa]
MGGEKMAKRSSFGNMVRKRLSDITNSQSQPKPSTQHEIPPQVSPIDEDYINQLIMELNLGKDRVKALQHELVCKDALLKAKQLDKKGKVDGSCQNNSHEGQQGAEECMADNDGKHRARNRRGNARSQSMGPSTTIQRGGGDKEKTESKRPCLRRQSARLKSQEQENLFELDGIIGFADTPMHEDGPTPLASSSIGRPLRKAAEKVQSYKEFPLNVKMRRTD